MKIVQKIVGAVLAIEALFVAVGALLVAQIGESMAAFDGGSGGIRPIGYLLLTVLLALMLILVVLLWLPTGPDAGARDPAAKAALLAAVMLQVLFVACAVWL